jgi:PAS domain S-box-containing protein
VPAGYFLVAYSQLDHQLSLLSELKATRLAKYIYIHRELWQYHTLRLAELADIPEAKDVATQQRLFDSNGTLVLETGDPPAWPVTGHSAPVEVAGSQVARVTTEASFRGILIQTGIVAAASSLVGLAVFFVLRILPLRIIDRTFAELEATQARYRLLFDANPFPMVVVHRDSLAILAANNAAIERYGWSREEFLKMTIADLRPPPDELPQRMLDLAKNPAGGAATFRGQRHRKKDGTIIEVEITSRAIEFDGQPAALSLAADVTDRNRIEGQLRQSQKMEALGQLTGGIAHDFNNILNVILANIDIMQEEEGEKLTPTAKDRLRRMASAVDRAAQFTRQLLSFSRKQPLRAQVIDVNELVADTAKLLKRTLGSQVEMDAVLSGDLWPVKVDRSQLEAALVNLCVNARDAMPDGGKLLIETRNETLDQEYVARNSDVVVGDYAVLAVTDSGAGMGPAELAHVFDPFFTTKAPGKGTGLGLSMVYGFIKQSEGQIRVDSTPGRGTTFKIHLPRTAELPRPTLAAQQPAMPRGDERILVVEDEPGVRATPCSI